MNAIAIVGMACVYPDALSPGELWENVLARRRAFRRIPPERLRLEDYFSVDPRTPDATYATEAAVIEGYEFDRVTFRVAGSTFRAADLAHWLALDVATKALADGGFAGGAGLPHASTGVLLGNTLTGEFSRANTLRLRWPYVRRIVTDALAKENWTAEQREKFLAGLEEKYKQPFPPVGEETLAGSLSNTIAGRICNQFDLKGGGYTVDGACASSLLAVASACSSLVAGDLDVAIAGGVDLSLDPFEIVGFAKASALARDEMHVFDQRSAGFWPGEGCGMVVLMRHDDALAQGRRVYAIIRGWGISSDGNGGITRPESDGQLEALRRAYRRAGFGVETVSYCEGHGTGTAIGDSTELDVLSRSRRESKTSFPPTVIGSIKANIGHTKAAAGVAGLIKATMAVHTQVLPPATGCEQPHAQLTTMPPVLRVLRETELWPPARPLRASVGAMGFGGINAHVVLENIASERRESLSARERLLSHSHQDMELFLFAADSPADLKEQVRKILSFAALISRSELTDLAAKLEENLRAAGTPNSASGQNLRAAVIAAKPSELAEKLGRLESWLHEGAASRLDLSGKIFLGSSETPPRIAFLFPGQGAPTYLDGGLWRRRFESVAKIYSRAALPQDGDSISTRVMQPAVVVSSLSALKVLTHLGIEAGAVIGHSLGEITALHWAGAFDEETLLRIARVRGAAMADLGSPTGAMLAIAAPWPEVQQMLEGLTPVIVGYNSPHQAVVAGETEAVKKCARLAEARGWPANLLQVSHAFHTPLVAAATPVLRVALGCEKFFSLKKKVFSTVTGGLLEPDCDLRQLLCRQVTSPVRFITALAAMDGAADLFIEAGPGRTLSGLIRDAISTPVIALDAGNNSVEGLLQAVGVAFALGAPVKTASLFSDRFTRPFALDWKPRFFVNPCEQAPVSNLAVRRPPARNEPETPVVLENAGSENILPLELIRRLIVERAELPASAIRGDSRMLSDLHLNSITVGQLISTAAKQLGLPHVVGLTDFANASLTEIARALEDLKHTGVAHPPARRKLPEGVGSWVRPFAVELIEIPRRKSANGSPNLSTDGIEKSLQLEKSGTFVENGWQMFAPENHPLAGSLLDVLNQSGVGGVVVCLPENPDMESIPLLLAGARAALAMRDQPRFVLVQHGWGGGGFSRTLHLENPGIIVSVMNVPADCSQAANWIASEVPATAGFSEVNFTGNGQRFEPRLRLAEIPPSAIKSNFLPGPEDVLLVTGGGKGIAAECALALARETGVRLGLLGRSDPKSDKELAKNIERFAASGVLSAYACADVTDAKAMGRAVAEIEGNLGPVTAILHGAGVNTPQLIGALDEEVFRRTVGPKISGLQNILGAVDVEKIKLLVTFGSIIARTGLSGEADYATANEWLAAMTINFQKKNPRCRCLTLEWSVWSGTGMGERLGRLETLIQQGITPITVDEGVRVFCGLLKSALPETSLVVASRFGEPSTLKMSKPLLPLRRFLERQRVFYPGVELIVDAGLSLRTDPYLMDHVVQKRPLLPAVLGLEAMAQTAMALAGSASVPVFENVEFIRPVAVSEQTVQTIRLVALRHENGCIEVRLRSEESDFQVDHFRAICRFASLNETNVQRLSLSPFGSEYLPLDPLGDLYGRILFHGGCFRRLRGYRLLKARECVAKISEDDNTVWFGPYLPPEFVLGNPASRDAALHAIQACIPHRRIVPTGIERLAIYRNEPGVHIVRSKERLRDGNSFVYDLEITNEQGDLIERWDGLRLRAMETITACDAWPGALLSPYLERRVEELAVTAGPVRIALERGFHEDRTAVSNKLIQQALGRAARIWRRPDGKPVFAGEEEVSVAHTNDLTLAVAGVGEAACDMETVVSHPDHVWRDLLGEEKFKLAQLIAREQTENIDTAATRLWTAIECMKKIGQPAPAPLVLETNAEDGWILLRSGAIVIPTCVMAVHGANSSLGLAVALQTYADHQPNADTKTTR
jgi:enediyne polyketide synthase